MNAQTYGTHANSRLRKKLWFFCIDCVSTRVPKVNIKRGIDYSFLGGVTEGWERWQEMERSRLRRKAFTIRDKTRCTKSISVN